MTNSPRLPTLRSSHVWALLLAPFGLLTPACGDRSDGAASENGRTSMDTSDEIAAETGSTHTTITGGSSSSTTLESAGSDSQTSSGSATTSNPDSDAGTTDESDESGTHPDDDPLAVCRALPAASLIDWRSSEPVEREAQSTPERWLAYGDATLGVALNLLRSVPQTEFPSYALSPSSLAMALGMAYGELEGSGCGDDIHSAMAFTEVGDAMHHTLGSAATELESRSLGAENGADPVVLRVENSRWFLKPSPGSPGEIQSLQRIYGAQRHAVVKSGEGHLEGIREVVNCSIEQQSLGLLKDFLPAGTPTRETMSYYVNVAALKSPWEVGFSEKVDIEFEGADGTTRQLPGMSGEGFRVERYEDAAFKLVTVPLRSSALSLVAVMPAVGRPADLDQLAGQLDVAAIRDARANAEHVPALLSMPRVEIPAQVLNLKNRLGIHDCSNQEVYAIYHGATVEMNDKGLSAAAASVVEDWEDGGSPDWEPVSIDRAFLFFVIDDPTGFVLFSGRFAGLG